jgi:hypothetical protein
MKLSVSLPFTRSLTFGRTPWTGDQLVARPLPAHKHRKTHTHKQTPNIHTLSRIRIHDPGFRASEDSACLRPLCYRDRQLNGLIENNSDFKFENVGASGIKLRTVEFNRLTHLSLLEMYFFKLRKL